MLRHPCLWHEEAAIDEYSEDRVRAGAAKLAKMLAAKQQGRLDGFFKPQPPKETNGTDKGKGGKAGDKRKADDKKGGPGKKKK